MGRHRDRLKGGEADAKSPKDFDPAQLKAGTAHEREHTEDEGLAQEIAMDHLSEDPDYYKKLRTIEKAKKLPVFTIRQRKDGTYKKVEVGKWKKQPDNPEESWAKQVRLKTAHMSIHDRDVWVGEQFRKAKKPIGHILYACRQILGSGANERQTGFKAFCQAILQKSYEHGPTGIESETLEIWNKAFKTLFERKEQSNVPLKQALSMAHSKPFFQKNVKWFRYCAERMARKNEGQVDMLHIERYMQNAMKKHKTPPAVDYDE